MHGNCCGICSHICRCTTFSNETREEEEDAAEAQRLKQLEEEEDKLLASEESSKKEREERDKDAQATRDAKEATKMAQERDARAAKDAQETQRDEEEARQDTSKQQKADQERGKREKEERDKGARERLAAEAYQSIFGPVGTSPLHALCLSCAICDDLMIPLVERTCGIEVWLGEEVWEGADAGMSQLMAMSPCVFDRHRLPLHAACSNGFCPSTCLALVLQECSDALWKTDGEGMTPLALLCTSHPPPLPSPRSAALSPGVDSSREAQGERNQVLPRFGE